MTIKLTNEQITKMLIIYSENQPIQSPAFDSLKKKKLPVKVQYWLRVIFNKVTEKYKEFEETRQEIVNQHAKKDESGKVIENDGNLTIESPVEFQKDIQELMSLEIDLGINKIKIDFEAWENNPKYDILNGDEMDLILPIMEVENG